MEAHKPELPVFIGCRIGCYMGILHIPEHFHPPQAVCPQANHCPQGTLEGRKWFKDHNGVYSDLNEWKDISDFTGS
jgi:hypothetical protein